jgi:large subunit ribosomal protein L4
MATTQKSSTQTETVTLDVDLPSEIFDVDANIPLIHQVVVAQQAAARQGTSDTKRRGEVRGGGRKPYKQKGTGRARQGSTRAPQFVGGGVVHGPHPRSYDQRTPKKMKAAALRGALSDRARSGRIHVVDSLVGGGKPSTKAAVQALVGLSGRRRQLIVLEREDAVTWLSLRNVASVHILAVDQLNTYDVLLADDVVFTKGAYDAFVGGTTSSSARPATIVEAPAADAVSDGEADAVTEETEAAPLPAGAKAPLKSGKAPKGFEIKGNQDSMLFHEPDGQWYDATDAELYFKTAEDAEAAGFTRAGSDTVADSGSDTGSDIGEDDK